MHFITPPLLKTFAAPVLAIAMLAVCPLYSAGAAASETLDLSASQPAGRMLRLGLQKSAVLKLPAVVKDVIVGNPEMVDVVLKNRSTAYLFARNAGQTNVFFLDGSGRQILQLDVEVTLDTKALKALLDRALPGNRIQVDSTGANIVLKGTVSDAQQGRTAEDLAKRFILGFEAVGSPAARDDTGVLNLLKIAGGNQVMLKVRVIELKRQVLKRLGINLSGEISAGPVNFAYLNTPFGIDVPDTLRGTLSFPAPFQVDATIRALEDSGLATVLAEPTLTATSGAPANFHAGGEYPYLNCDQPDDNNNVQYECTTDFRNYGITLDFTPTVLTEGRIALNVYTEVSDLADNPYGTQPLIDTRNAQTSVELPTGGSMMLAGLINNVSLQKMQNTPGLRSLPVLGALFSSQEFQRRQTELVVIVTPYVVNPTTESKLATPLDRFNNATDLQQFFLGRLNKVYGLPDGGSAAANGPAPGTYHGQVGYIIE